MSTRGMKLAEQHSVFKHLGDPLTVAAISLCARDLLAVRRIDQEDFHLTFAQVEDGFAVNACRFHRHHRAAVGLQPVMHRQQLRGGSSIGADL